MALLFNGMQSSLSMVYDRELGVMRLLLTAPLPRWYMLSCKLIAGTVLSVIQAYIFLGIAAVLGLRLPVLAYVQILPVLLLVGWMLGAFGLLLSVHIRQLENFAGTMNFIIFPLFFLSTALFPATRLDRLDSDTLAWIVQLNPFTYGVELIRFAAYGQVQGWALMICLLAALGSFWLAVLGYDPQRGLLRRRPSLT